MNLLPWEVIVMLSDVETIVKTNWKVFSNSQSKNFKFDEYKNCLDGEGK